MPVLPQFQGADTLGAFNRGAQTVSGFMDRRNQRTLDQQNIEANQQKLELNSLLRPVVEAKATADLMTNLSAIKQQEYNLKQQENIAQTRIEAGDRFDYISNIDPFYAGTPEQRAQLAQERKGMLTAYVQDFGSYAGDPAIGPQVKLAQEELKQIVGAEEFARQEQMKQYADEQARISAQQARLQATEKFLGATVPNFQWNTPIPVEGNPSIGIVYSATQDGGYTTRQVYTQPREGTAIPEERVLSTVRRLKDAGDVEGAKFVFNLARSKANANSLFGGSSNTDQWDQMEQQIFGQENATPGSPQATANPATQPLPIPVAAVQHLKDNPATRPDFEDWVARTYREQNQGASGEEAATYAKQAADLILSEQ